MIPSKEELQRFYEALDDLRDKVLFLILATTGLRREEALSLTLDDLDRERRMIIPKNHSGNEGTKRSWVSFYYDEAEEVLERFLASRNCGHSRIFWLSSYTNLKTWRKATKKTGIHITPKVLRGWFCCEMGRRGVSDRYVDAFYG